MADPKLIILVHGWSVRSTDTYGQLPNRLEAEAKAQAGLDLDIKNIWLGRYISFHDAVTLADLSEAFQAALRRECGAELDKGRRFVAITHSTGGPVVRDWWNRFYAAPGKLDACPLSHLIMLAPANFGSALAQLGKSVVGRLSVWFDDVDPGQGVLDWLELGSPEGLALNRQWVVTDPPWKNPVPMFPFVLTGQTIDRKLYDHVNSYTGETGSDGVVRVAAANLNCSYVRLVQQEPTLGTDEKGKPAWVAPELRVDEHRHASKTAFAVLPKLAHSGKEIGILRSIKTRGPHAAVSAILRCLTVNSPDDYQRVCNEFEALTKTTQEDERIEPHGKILLPDTFSIHDRYTMVVARVMDDHGHALDDFDLLMLGQGGSPDRLPPGFLIDRQRNKRSHDTLTYYLNHDVMMDGPALTTKEGEVLRPALPGATDLGFRVTPRPGEGFVHYLKAELEAKAAVLEEFLAANSTLMLDIVVRRIVRSGTFTLTQDRNPKDFTKTLPGDPIGS